MCFTSSAHFEFSGFCWPRINLKSTFENPRVIKFESRVIKSRVPVFVYAGVCACRKVRHGQRLAKRCENDDLGPFCRLRVKFESYCGSHRYNENKA